MSLIDKRMNSLLRLSNPCQMTVGDVNTVAKVRAEGTGKTDPAKAEKVNFTPFLWRTNMNTLQIIKNQIKKASATHDAQIHVTKYRGVECQVHETGEASHGTFCYRGRVYVK